MNWEKNRSPLCHLQIVVWGYVCVSEVVLWDAAPILFLCLYVWALCLDFLFVWNRRMTVVKYRPVGTSAITTSHYIPRWFSNLTHISIFLDFLKIIRNRTYQKGLWSQDSEASFTWTFSIPNPWITARWL